MQGVSATISMHVHAVQNEMQNILAPFGSS